MVMEKMYKGRILGKEYLGHNVHTEIYGNARIINKCLCRATFCCKTINMQLFKRLFNIVSVAKSHEQRKTTQTG